MSVLVFPGGGGGEVAIEEGNNWVEGGSTEVIEVEEIEVCMVEVDAEVDFEEIEEVVVLMVVEVEVVC